MPFYDVQPGDCIDSLAYDRGLLPDSVWKAPENAELRTLRKNGNVLCEGDRIFLPDKQIKEVPAATDARHCYTRKGVPAKLQIRFVDEEGNPRTSVAYVLKLDGKLINGTTDGDGWLKEPIPPNAKNGLLTFDSTEEYPLQLGVLDPLATIQGLQDRLFNLGYPCGSDQRGTIGEGTTAAIQLFREDQNLLPFSELTDDVLQETRNALAKQHQV